MASSAFDLALPTARSPRRRLAAGHHPHPVVARRLGRPLDWPPAPRAGRLHHPERPLAHVRGRVLARVRLDRTNDGSGDVARRLEVRGRLSRCPRGSRARGGGRGADRRLPNTFDRARVADPATRASVRACGEPPTRMWLSGRWLCSSRRREFGRSWTRRAWRSPQSAIAVRPHGRWAPCRCRAAMG